MTYKELVFGELDDFEVLNTEKANNTVVINVASTQSGSECPNCKVLSKSVHSYYFRSLMDLPMLDNETWIRLKARKFYCGNGQCQIKVFTERFTSLFGSGKRITERVKERVLKVAMLMGGNGGEKLCRLMKMPVCSSTLIRAIHHQPVKQNETPKILGIDDWAFKKRLNYGTVMVDMERRKIIDLLPDRETDSVRRWLEAHPGVQVVSRDRYSNFANGVKQASEDIVQVADRWHLLKNMGDAIQKTIDRNYIILKSAREKEIRRQQDLHAKEIESTAAVQEEIKGILQRKFYKVKELLAQGLSISKISQEAGVQRVTIRRWKEFDALPIKKAHNRTNMYLYEQTVRDLVTENPAMEIKEILASIIRMGFTGSRSQAYLQIAKIRGKKPKEYLPKMPHIYLIPSRTSILLYCNPEKLSTKEKRLVDDLCLKSEEIKRTAELALSFRVMMENKDGAGLIHWINEAIHAGVKELKEFARGLISDFDAVKNAIMLPWSNGQVEGQVNRLKTIKRQMYGRASFELLRKRLICDTG